MAMLKITMYLTYTYNEVQRDLWLSQLAKSIFSELCFMDTSYIVLWVLVRVRNMNVKDFVLAAFQNYIKGI